MTSDEVDVTRNGLDQDIVIFGASGWKTPEGRRIRDFYSFLFFTPMTRQGRRLLHRQATVAQSFHRLGVPMVELNYWR
jgi:hypothetical protein